MSARKNHTKSRKGCAPCKSRHVKCDETRPHCSNCGRLDLACSWSQVPSSKSSSPAAAPAYTTPHVEGAINGGSTPQESRTVELRLLHHWILHTAATISPGQQELRLWQDHLVEFSFEHRFLLDGILALAATHKAVMLPGDRASLSVQASTYMNSAISSFRSKLGNVEARDVIPVFALACLLITQHLAAGQVIRPEDPIESLCFMAKLTQGVGKSVSPFWGYLAESEVAPLLLGIDRSLPVASEAPELRQLQDWVVQLPTIHETLRTDCVQAVEDLRVVSRNIAHKKDHGPGLVAITLNWPAALSPRYVDHWSEKHPVTLVILAHFAVFCHLHEDIWLMRGWALWTFEAVQQELGPDYQEQIEWPRRVFQGMTSAG